MNSSTPYGPTADETFYQDASSTPAALTSANLVDAYDRKAIWAEITAMDYAIIYAFGTNPTTGSFGHILGADQTMILSSPGDVAKFKFAAKVAGACARVVITPKF